MSVRTLCTIERESVEWDAASGILSFRGRGRIDDDGTGAAHGDPDHQRDTSLHHAGKPLNADVDRYCVLPEQLARMIAPRVLGCLVLVTYRGKTYRAVCGDLGPKTREGEISIALAREMGIDPNPNTGGDDSPDLHFEFHAGVPATVGATSYQLQAV